MTKLITIAIVIFAVMFLSITAEAYDPDPVHTPAHDHGATIIELLPVDSTAPRQMKGDGWIVPVEGGYAAVFVAVVDPNVKSVTITVERKFGEVYHFNGSVTPFQWYEGYEGEAQVSLVQIPADSEFWNWMGKDVLYIYFGDPEGVVFLDR